MLIIAAVVNDWYVAIYFQGGLTLASIPHFKAVNFTCKEQISYIEA